MKTFCNGHIWLGHNPCEAQPNWIYIGPKLISLANLSSNIQKKNDQCKENLSPTWSIAMEEIRPHKWLEQTSWAGKEWWKAIWDGCINEWLDLFAIERSLFPCNPPFLNPFFSIDPPSKPSPPSSPFFITSDNHRATPRVTNPKIPLFPLKISGCFTLLFKNHLGILSLEICITDHPPPPSPLSISPPPPCFLFGLGCYH